MFTFDIGIYVDGSRTIQCFDADGSLVAEYAIPANIRVTA